MSLDGRRKVGRGDMFKSGLDAWLSKIPDQPTVHGRQMTNSLIDQLVTATSIYRTDNFSSG